jgi:hypothetical protein
MGSARADVIESSPTLPLLGFPYTIPGGSCFPTAGFCAAGGSFTLTSVVPGGFVQSGGNEYITTKATDTIDLTYYPSLASAGTVTLTGTITQEVVGRLSPSATGTWTAYITSMSLNGTLDGHTLTLGLVNPADLSLDQGTTSLTPEGVNSPKVVASSFFDVYTEISYGLLTTTHKGTATATGVPEPATLVLFAGPLLALAAVRRRRS